MNAHVNQVSACSNNFKRSAIDELPVEITHQFTASIATLGGLFAQVKLATQLVFLFAISPLMTCGSQGSLWAEWEISMEVLVPRKMDVL
jgi:hypothetical protein